MNPGIGYSLLAALVWGVYLFVLKRSFDGYPPATLTVCLNAFAIAWYAPVTYSALGGDEAALPALTAPNALVVLGTGVATAAAFVLFLRALAGGEVSYVTPINKVVPVFVLPLEVLLLGQALAPLQVVGVFVATLGVYVANYRRGRLLDPLRRAARSRPARLALASAVCYAVSDLGKRVALQELAVSTAVWVPLLLGAILLILLPLAVAERNVGVVGDLPKFAAAALFVAVGEHVTSLAFSLAPASVASPIINTQAIVAVLLGGLLLREAALEARLAAAALAVTGVTLIAL